MAAFRCLEKQELNEDAALVLTLSLLKSSVISLPTPRIEDFGNSPFRTAFHA